MRKQLIRAALATGSVVAAMVVAIPPAMASGTWTVSEGPNWTSVVSSGTTFTLTDTTASLNFTCLVGTANGTVINETMGTLTTIGSVIGSTFGSAGAKCNGPLGSTGTAAQKSGTTATLNAVSFSGGTTTGNLSFVDEVMTISSILGACTAEVKGTAGVKYTNSSKLLQFTTAGDSLKVTTTSGKCVGIIKTNDVLTVNSGTGGETITGAPVSAITISQP